MAVSNQENFNEVARLIATREGREYVIRQMFSETKFPNAWGHYFTILEIINGIERRTAEQNAIAASLVSALAAVAGGESFDEAKLLAGVQSAAEAGVKNAIESIQTTVTVKANK